MRILVLGGSGFIGVKLVEKLLVNHDIVATYHRTIPTFPQARWIRLDVNGPQSLDLLLRDIAPDIIINLVTYAQGNSHVEACQQNPTQCPFVNSAPTGVIATYCREFPETKYIFFSSSQVFSGKGRHREKDCPHPANEYGKSKLQAEKIAETAPQYAIVRPCFVFGVPLPFQHGNIFMTIYNALRERKEFTAYTDMIRSPCYVQDVIKVVEQIILKNAQGTFHVPGHAASVYEFGRAIATFFGLDGALLKASSAANEPPYRTRDTSLDSTSTQEQLSITATPRDDAFAEMKVMLI